MIDQQLSDSIDSRGDVETDRALVRINGNLRVMSENESAARNSQEVAAAAQTIARSAGESPDRIAEGATNRNAVPGAVHPSIESSGLATRCCPSNGCCRTSIPARRAPLDPAAVEDMIREAIEARVSVTVYNGCAATSFDDRLVKLELEEGDGYPHTNTLRIVLGGNGFIDYERDVRYEWISTHQKYDTNTAIIVTYGVEAI